MKFITQRMLADGLETDALGSHKDSIEVLKTATDGFKSSYEDMADFDKEIAFAVINTTKAGEALNESDYLKYKKELYPEKAGKKPAKKSKVSPKKKPSVKEVITMATFKKVAKKSKDVDDFMAKVKDIGGVPKSVADEFKNKYGVGNGSMKDASKKFMDEHGPKKPAKKSKVSAKKLIARKNPKFPGGYSGLLPKLTVFLDDFEVTKSKSMETAEVQVQVVGMMGGKVRQDTFTKPIKTFNEWRLSAKLPEINHMSTKPRYKKGQRLTVVNLVYSDTNHYLGDKIIWSKNPEVIVLEIGMGGGHGKIARGKTTYHYEQPWVQYLVQSIKTHAQAHVSEKHLKPTVPPKKKVSSKTSGPATAESKDLKECRDVMKNAGFTITKSTKKDKYGKSKTVETKVKRTDRTIIKDKVSGVFKTVNKEVAKQYKPKTSDPVKKKAELDQVKKSTESATKVLEDRIAQIMRNIDRLVAHGDADGLTKLGKALNRLL